MFPISFLKNINETVKPNDEAPITHKLEMAEQNNNIFTGEIDKTLLFFGHQHRFQESLIKKMNDIDANISNYKFSNGAILNLVIEPSDISYNLYLSLEYSGDISANKTGEKYWIDTTQTPVNNAKYNFELKKITVTKDDFNRLFKNSSPITKTISCYFVRHGKAKHNIVKTVNLEKNTDLVNPSNDIAIIKGGEILSIKTNSIDYIFVSDLIRTQQTAALFLQGYTGKTPDKIYVLPCLHELNGKMETTNLPYYENQTTCNHNENDTFYKDTAKTCKEITIKTVSKTLEWSEYEKFFTEYDKHRTKGNQEICNNEHFLGIALKIITSTTNIITGVYSLNGGKPKKRTTRKARKSQKPKKSRKSTR